MERRKIGVWRRRKCDGAEDCWYKVRVFEKEKKDSPRIEKGTSETPGEDGSKSAATEIRFVGRAVRGSVDSSCIRRSR